MEAVTNQPRWKKVCAIKALEPEHDPLLLITLTDEELTDYLLDMGLEIIAVRRELPPYNTAHKGEIDANREDPSREL